MTDLIPLDAAEQELRNYGLLAAKESKLLHFSTVEPIELKDHVDIVDARYVMKRPFFTKVLELILKSWGFTFIDGMGVIEQDGKDFTYQSRHIYDKAGLRGHVEIIKCNLREAGINV